MAESMFAWLSIVVKQTENMTKPREILKHSWTDTFGSYLEVWKQSPIRKYIPRGHIQEQEVH